MNTRNMEIPDISDRILSACRFVLNAAGPAILFGSLLLLWCYMPGWLQNADATAGAIDQSIWLLVLLSLISFLLVVALCWWLLQHFWKTMGLPAFSTIISQFNTLALWQQLSFYWVSFFSLLLAALGCLIAIC